MVRISVIIATYNRAHLIEKALLGYLRQDLDFPIGEVEFIYLDDWSTDHTDRVLREAAQVLNVTVIRPPYKQPGTWRSEASIINQGLRAAKGELVIATHPEIIPGTRSLQDLWDNRKPMTFLTCKTLFLTQLQQQNLDIVDWLSSNRAVYDIPGFFYNDVGIAGADNEYTHVKALQYSVWHSWQFAGMLRETWRWFGGFGEYESWGTTDVDFVDRRRLLGIGNYTAMDEETLVIHQNHDALDGHNRNVERVLRDLKRYNKDTARLNNL